MTDVDPYALVASLYDAEFSGAAPDAAFFARSGESGRLLVLGCGTGRVSALLAQTRPVTGVDRSEPMLALARRKDPSSTYVHADITAHVAGAVGEVVVPNGTFGFLRTRAQRAACLLRARDALRESGGPLTIDLPFPDVRLLGVPHTPEALAWEGWLDGRPARRSREVFRRAATLEIDLVDRFHVDDILVATSTLPLRLSWPDELEWMLEACGFWVESMVGDYAGGPIRDGCPRLIARARPLEPR